LGNLSALLRLSLSHNSLTGTFPKELEGLSNLRSLLLQSNILKGNIDGAFNAVTQTSLEVIDISDNTLTGQFSTELFFLPRLRVLALSGEEIPLIIE
jgi:Ran GTPase-activating protein (RanGAP) involved in mRNA processing and transport